jgi:hypothetical protein
VQVVVVGPLPDVPVGSRFLLDPATPEGLPLTYFSLTPANCEVNGTAVTTLGVGTCTIRADQAGTAAVAPASGTGSFQVTPARGALPVVVVNGPFTFGGPG